MAKTFETCKNCEQRFNDQFNFCPYCGQQAKDDLTVKVLFYNTISNYFSFDARFFKSFLPLVLKPGFIARKFVEGKRLIYLHPAQMYLFVAVVFFFLFSFVQREQAKAIDDSLAEAFKKEKAYAYDLKLNKSQRDSIKEVLKNLNGVKDSLDRLKLRKTLEEDKFFTGISDAKIDSLINAENSKHSSSIDFGFDTKHIDSLLAVGAEKDSIYNAMGMEDDAGAFKKRLYQQALKFYETKRGGSIIQTFYDTVPIAMFFLLPIFALTLKLFHRKKGRYAHHLVFSFYYFSFLFTVFSAILIINFIIDLPDWLDFLIMLSTFIYLIVALKRFYLQGWFKSVLKAALTSFVFLSIVTPIAFIILGMFAFLFY